MKPLLFLGAGVSLASELPDAKGLTEKLFLARRDEAEAAARAPGDPGRYQGL